MKEGKRGRAGVYGWLEVATAFMQGLSRLLRYVLVTVLVVIALVFSVSSALAGNVEPVTGFVGGLLKFSGGMKNSEQPLRPLFNFEIKPQQKVCPPGKSA